MFKDNKLFDWYDKRQIAKSKEYSLENALLLKKEQQFDRCAHNLSILSHSGKCDDQLIACYELATLHSQMGNHALADSYLRKIGFRYKLSPMIMSPNFACSNSTSGNTLNKVAVFDNVIPQGLLISLRKAFSNDSSFWTEHNYPTKEFFSYNMAIPLKSTESSNLMQELVSHLKPIVTSAFPAKHLDEQLQSVEWWCHVRSETTSTAHQLHFDLDEVALSGQMSGSSARDGASIHPLVSSVLYLNECCDNLAPTLVTNQTLDPNSVASESWMCQPAENRLLLFDGDFLHGVVPYLSPDTLAGIKGGACSTPRITLMIGWWAAGVHTSEPKKHQFFLGPNMRMPSAIDEPNSLSSSSVHSVLNSGSSNTTGWNIPNKKLSLAKSTALTTTITSKSTIYRCPYVNTTVTWPLALRCSNSLATCSSTSTPPIPSTALKRIDGPVWVRVSPSNARRPSVTTLRKRLYGFKSDCSPVESVAVHKSKEESVSGGAIEYMSVADLNKLRAASGDSSSSKKQKQCAVSTTVSSPSAVEFMSMADLQKLRGEGSTQSVTSRKGDKQNKNATHSVLSGDDGVEYMSIADLNKLRSGDSDISPVRASPPAHQVGRHKDFSQFDSSGAFIGGKGNRLSERRERRLERLDEARDSVAFFGRWFLRDLEDIYNEVVQGSGSCEAEE